MGFGFLFTLALIGLVIYFLLNGQGTNLTVPGKPNGRDPLAIIDERYARGEITREEYLRLKEDLQK